MKKESLLALRELFVTQMNYWAVFPLVVTCMVLVQYSVPKAPAPRLLWWAVFCVVPFLLYLVRVKCRVLAVFLLLHCAPAALAILVPTENAAYRALLVCVMLGFTVYSFFLRFVTEDRLDRGLSPIVAVGLAGVCVFLQHYLKYTRWDSFCINALIVTLGLFFMTSWLDSFLNFLEVNKGSANRIPERAMFRSGLRLSTCYTLLGMGVLLITANFEWLRAVLGTVWELFRRTVAWILSHFHLDSGSNELLAETQESSGSAELAFEAEETFWLWIVLEYVAYFALAIGLVCALLWGICRVIRFVRENWVGMRRVLSADGSAEGEADLHEKLENGENAFGERVRRSLLDRLSPRERIRKYYRKQASGLEKAAYVTARECGAALNLPGLAEIYEKARYSGQECTAADVRRMKEACRRN